MMTLLCYKLNHKEYEKILTVSAIYYVICNIDIYYILMVINSNNLYRLIRERCIFKYRRIKYHFMDGKNG
jgi:CDP-diacylglycerol pyrophosphatase